VQGECGQATVEWVALVLLAALVLTAATAMSTRESDRDLGELVAKRIARAPSELAPAPATAAPGRTPAAPRASAPPAPAPRMSAPPAPAPRAVEAFRGLRGVADVAKRAWIFCLGYRRWKYELEHPSAPTEALPLGEALSIANTCLNPYGYLLED
jgi:hypothetical protein